MLLTFEVKHNRDEENKMTPIRECSAEERMLRALLAIEYILSGDALPESAEEVQKNAELIRKIMSDIYCIAHAGHGQCCEGGISKWLDLIEKCESHLDAKI